MEAATIVLTLLLSVPAAQSLEDVRRLYDAGKYREVVEAVSSASAEGPADARLLYLAAQSHQKLDEADGARQVYGQLADREDTDPWRFIGRSALSLMDRNLDDALKEATQAVDVGGEVPEAHYQLGLAYTFKKDFPRAAGAFDKATKLDRGFAYAHYYAGLSYYKAKRIDLMASHFEAFLKLAPEAPERREVESIMRTVRGR